MRAPCQPGGLQRFASLSVDFRNMVPESLAHLYLD